MRRSVYRLGRPWDAVASGSVALPKAIGGAFVVNVIELDPAEALRSIASATQNLSPIRLSNGINAKLAGRVSVSAYGGGVTFPTQTAAFRHNSAEAEPVLILSEIDCADSRRMLAVINHVVLGNGAVTLVLPQRALDALVGSSQLAFPPSLSPIGLPQSTSTSSLSSGTPSNSRSSNQHVAREAELTVLHDVSHSPASGPRWPNGSELAPHASSRAVRMEELGAAIARQTQLEHEDLAEPEWLPNTDGALGEHTSPRTSSNSGAVGPTQEKYSPPSVTAAFLTAAQFGDLEALVRLGAEHASAVSGLVHTHTEVTGATPLHLWVGSAGAQAEPAVGEAGVAQLLAWGADTNARAANGSTPLHWAAGAGSSALVDVLLRAGADPMLSTYTWKRQVFGRGSGQLPLHWAAESNHVACVQQLQRHAWMCALIPDERGVTPLALAHKEMASDAAAALTTTLAEKVYCLRLELGASYLSLDPIRPNLHPTASRNTRDVHHDAVLQ